MLCHTLEFGNYKQTNNPGYHEVLVVLAISHCWNTKLTGTHLGVLSCAPPASY